MIRFGWILFFWIQTQIYSRCKFDINIFRKYSNVLFISFSIFPPFMLFLSRIFRWANLVGKEKNETLASPFARSLFFRTWLRMLARPPWRTTIKVMGSDYLEPDIPSHERFGAPSNLRATAFPPSFLDCSRLLSFQTESRFNGWFFSKTLLPKSPKFFYIFITQQSDFSQHLTQRIFC